MKTHHVLLIGAVLVGLWLLSRGQPVQPWNMRAEYLPGGLYGGGQ